MTIDEAYRFINYVANKEQRGVIKPADFNLLIANAQIELVSKRVGNVKALNDRAIPQFGYKINRKLLEDLRTLLTQTTQAIASDGYLTYPSDYFYIDSIYKEDFTEIRIVNSDEYPKIKKSIIVPPTTDYPVAVPFNDKVLVDPLASQNCKFNYIKYPTTPVWAYTEVDGQPVYDAGNSVQLSTPKHTHVEICMIALQSIGINLDAAQITQYASMRESTIG
jgi:hypothetical protein